MSGSFPQRVPNGGIEEAYYQLTERADYTATHRVTDVTDTSEAFDLYVGNPSGSETDLLASVGIGAGGAAHLDTGENASVDVAGTDLPRQAKGSNGTGTARIEQGGTYTSENTLETVITGSRRNQQPSGSNGADELPDVRLLEPGEAVQYAVTNQSGNTVDFDVVVNAAEVDA